MIFNKCNQKMLLFFLNNFFRKIFKKMVKSLLAKFFYLREEKT